MGVKGKPPDSTVAVIGLGYAGLPLALEFARAGVRVIGLDVDSEKIRQLKDGGCYLKHVSVPDLASLVEQGRFRPATDFSDLREAEGIIICVPTPVTESLEPDLQFVVSSSQTISRYLERGQLIVLESTTYPGTTEEVVLPILEESGLRCPKGPQPRQPAGDFYLAFSPERIDPGNRRFALADIPKIIGGVNAASAERAKKLYSRVFKKVVVVSTTQAAEMAKLLENIYRAVNVALVNELKMICQRLGIDIWEVIEAAATKPFGFAPFYPGPGLGGHCIPIDPFYLAWKVRQHGMTTRFIELAGEINTAMADHVVQSIGEALKASGKELEQAKILILGVAYKKDIDDTRESPALRIMHLLKERGAAVAYNDPHVPQLPRTRRYDFSGLASVPLERVGDYDCVVIVTDHSSYDFGQIVKEARLIVDTRNATQGLPHSAGKVVSA